MSGFNIKEQQAEAAQEDRGIAVHIHDLNDLPMYFYTEPDEQGEKHPVSITVYGANSTQYREVEARQRKRRLKPKDLTGQSLNDDVVMRVAHCTKSWQGFGDDDGEEMRCNFANARVLYVACPDVMSQLQEAMGDHARFGKSGSSSQAST